MADRRGILLALAALTTIGAGSFVLQREVAGNLQTALLLSLAWAGVVSAAALLYARGRRGLTRPLVTGLMLGALAGAAAFYFASIRDVKVDEEVVMADPVAAGPAANVALSKGMFTGADGHDGRGTATVVRSAGGERRLTFTHFDVSPGAKVEVWLTPAADETSEHIELGGLKGNVGDQQYEIPAGADLGRYSHVVLYCTPFTVRIAVAPLISL